MQKLKLDQVEESKYFVDMKLKFPEQKTLEDFNTLTDNDKNDREFMSNWLNDYFDPPGSEFQNHQFDQVKFHYRLNNFQTSKMKLDKVEYPKMLDKIENEDYRRWALELHQIWQQERINTSNHLV